MIRRVNEKKDAVEQPASQPMPKAESRPYVFQIEELETRVAPCVQYRETDFS